MEDLNLYLKDVLTERPHTRVPSADTVLRGIEELATGNMLTRGLSPCEHAGTAKTKKQAAHGV